MKNFKKYLLVGLLIVVGSLASCKKNLLNVQPTNIVTDQQIWTDTHLIQGLMASFYDRIPSEIVINDFNHYIALCDYDEAMYSGQNNAANEAHNNIVSYANNRNYSTATLYDYVYIRDLNEAIINADKFGAVTLDAPTRAQLKAEFRFLRAFMYFQMVIRFGGVPLVTTPLDYDYSGNAVPLRQPRNKESEVYDFIASEMDAIIPTIGNLNPITKVADNSRANMYTCYALKSRAMLYAASIAKYNALNTPSITTPGGEVGIPAASAPAYYQKAYDASMAVINSGLYQLYNVNPNAGENFYDAIRQKGGNKEVILVKDFLTSKSKKHLFTYDNIARSVREDNLSSSTVTPTLGLVEAYDKLDGTPGTIQTNVGGVGSDFVYYTNLTDAFANRDARLYGTIVYPGAPFKGSAITEQAGVMTWNGTSYVTSEGTVLGSTFTDGLPYVAASGPNRTLNEVTNTGFYLRKFVDQGALTSTRGVQSDVWWIWFRLGEMYLNAAESAWELGNVPNALAAINPLRARAGFTGANLYTAATLTRDKIRNEFRCELAFEDHRIWDLKRWRIADQVLSGGTLANANASAVGYALYPYRIIRPGDPARDGKFVFVRLIAPRFKAPRFFQTFNYYVKIDQTTINNNPLIVQNPFF